MKEDANSPSATTVSQAQPQNASEDSISVDSAPPGSITSASDANDGPVKVLRTDQIRDKVEDVAKDWYGVPYEWSGESMDGIDCSAFVQRVYQQAFAYRLPRVTETQVQTGSKVSRSQIRPGDLVFFRPEGEWNHVGVYLGNRTFAHASSSDGVTESNFDKSYWKRYYWTARRPLKPSVIPDSLETQLVAYRYGDEAEADKTDRPAGQQAQEEESDRPETERPNAAAITIASCSSAEVECADEDPPEEGDSGTKAAAAADTTTRKGW